MTTANHYFLFCIFSHVMLQIWCDKITNYKPTVAVIDEKVSWEILPFAPYVECRVYNTRTDDYQEYSSGIMLYDSIGTSEAHHAFTLLLVLVTSEKRCVLWMNCDDVIISKVTRNFNDIPYSLIKPHITEMRKNLIQNSRKEDYHQLYSIEKPDFRHIETTTYEYMAIDVSSISVSWSLNEDLYRPYLSNKCNFLLSSGLCDLSDHIKIMYPESSTPFSYLLRETVSIPGVQLFKKQIMGKFISQDFQVVLTINETNFRNLVGVYRTSPVFQSSEGILFSWILQDGDFSWSHDHPTYSLSSVKSSKSYRDRWLKWNSNRSHSKEKHILMI